MAVFPRCGRRVLVTGVLGGTGSRHAVKTVYQAERMPSRSSVHAVSLSLFLFKAAIPAVLVAVMSLAARRWGATVGGLIMGLPWMSGPVLLFLALDKGEAFAVGATIGIEIGVISIAAYVLAYAAASRIGPWPLALAVSALGFAATALITSPWPLELWQAAIAAVTTLLGALLFLPKPRSVPQPARLPSWDIPARMATTFALVAIILASADRFGPRLSGIIATFPVILVVVGCFTHHQSGRDAVLRVLRGVSLSLIGFCLFFLVVGYALPVIGLVPSFTVGAICGVAFSACLIAISRKG